MADLSVEQILSGSVLGLSSGLDDLFVLSVGGRDVLYALNRAENRLFEVEIGASGALTLTGALAFGGTFAAGRPLVRWRRKKRLVALGSLSLRWALRWVPCPSSFRAHPGAG